MFPFAFAIFFLGLGALWFFLNHCKNDRKLPPGPGGLPIIGHLHMLGNLPHRTLHQLANKYGPIMSMRLGYVPTIVVSSAQAAKLFLKTHDVVFASRPKVQASKYMAYGVKGMAFTEYGSYWRNVRKLCTMELLSTTKIDSFAAVRREELRLVVESLKDAAAAREVVDISARTGEFIRNVTYRMVFGCIIDERFDLKGVIGEVVSLAGAFNLADYVPFLGALDLQGLTRRLKATSGAIDKILEMIIDDHVQDANGHERHHKDFIDVMLSLMNKPINSHDESQYMIDRSNIKAIVLDMLVGAIDTSATAIEWTLSELLRHPRVMKRLQEELESVIGMDQMLEETDLAKLVYLDMVVKESLRLHPVAPLLVPHESMEDIMINGYYIPKKSRIIINYFAIGRDRDAWSDNVEEFSPERFIGSNIDLRGREFQLIPFGSGRRGCPGMQLGLITIKLVLAQLVHGFDWELPNGMSPKDMDMSEEFGLALPRRNHLLAMPIHRSHI